MGEGEASEFTRIFHSAICSCIRVFRSFVSRMPTCVVSQDLSRTRVRVHVRVLDRVRRFSLLVFVADSSLRFVLDAYLTY